MVVPGGFGIRGIEGKVGALRHVRERGIPALGLCLGLQCMVIEAARNLAGIEDANSAEFAPETPDPVIATMASQVAAVAGEADLGGTMRLGAYPATLVPGSVVAQAYGSTAVSERHRHRYEVNNAYREQLEQAGLVVSGESPDGRLVEFVELPRDVHPFYAGDAGPPRAEVAPDPRAPAVPGVRRARRWTTTPPTGCRSRSRTSAASATADDGPSRRPGPRWSHRSGPSSDGRAGQLRRRRLRDRVPRARSSRCASTTCG